MENNDRYNNLRLKLALINFYINGSQANSFALCFISFAHLFSNESFAFKASDINFFFSLSSFYETFSFALITGNGNEMNEGRNGMFKSCFYLVGTS